MIKLEVKAFLIEEKDLDLLEVILVITINDYKNIYCASVLEEIKYPKEFLEKLVSSFCNFARDDFDSFLEYITSNFYYRPLRFYKGSGLQVGDWEVVVSASCSETITLELSQH